MQNGLGLDLKMLNQQRHAVIVFSPPESWLMLHRLLARRTRDDLDPRVQDVDLDLARRQRLTLGVEDGRGILGRVQLRSR